MNREGGCQANDELHQLETALQAVEQAAKP